jgi:hypothetical protein
MDYFVQCLYGWSQAMTTLTTARPGMTKVNGWMFEVNGEGVSQTQ